MWRKIRTRQKEISNQYEQLRTKYPQALNDEWIQLYQRAWRKIIEEEEILS